MPFGAEGLKAAHDVRASQKVRTFSSVTREAGKVSRVDDAVARFPYDSNIQPVNSASLFDHLPSGR